MPASGQHVVGRAGVRHAGGGAVHHDLDRTVGAVGDLARYLQHHAPVGQAEEDDAGPLRHLRRGAGRRRARRRQRLRAGGIEAHHLVTGGGQIVRHGAAHVAEADEA